MMWRTAAADSQLCAVAVQILANYFSFKKSCLGLGCLHCASRLPEMSISLNTNALVDFVFDFVFEG